MERIITLSELKRLQELGMNLADVIAQVEQKHGLVKVFDHSPEKMGGMRFRYYVMPLDKHNQPITKLSKGVQLQ